MNSHDEKPRGDQEGGPAASEAVSGSFEFPVDVDELGAVFEVIEEFADRAGWSMEFNLQVQLVLEEMVLNVMNHSGATDPAMLKLESRGGEARFDIIDRGVPFDPTQAPAPPEQDASSLMEMAIGGLGIHLVRSMVQEMRYRREGDANHLTLVMAVPQA